MKNKKTIIILSIILSVCACVAVVCGCVFSCNKNTETSSPDSSVEEREITISFTRDEVTVVRFETVELIAETEGTDEAIAWSSSDNNVATVDVNGLVSGVNVGTAYIFANVADKSAKCTVTVTENHNLPVIKFANGITIEQGKTYTGDVSVLFSGKTVTDQTTIDCTLADGSNASICDVQINGSVLSFKAKEIGNAEYYISATYKDKFVNKTLAVSVVEPGLSILPDGERLVIGKNGYEVNLCMLEEDGKVSSVPFKASVLRGDEVVNDAEIDWTFSKDGIAEIEKDGEQFIIKKVASGETELCGRYTKDGKTVSITINVTVTKLIKQLTDEIVIEVEDLKDVAIPSGITGDITSVELNGENVMASISEGKITLNKGKLPKTADKLGKRELTICTDEVEYKINAEVYSLIISNKNELNSMRDIARSNGGNIRVTGVMDGYFLLDGDIAYNGEYLSFTDSEEMYVVASSSWRNSAEYGFRGVFDGRGYNIDGMTIKPISSNGSGGFIGYMNDSGIFKNVSFTNAVVKENSGFICSIGGGLIENVSVTYKSVGVGNETRDFGKSNDPRTMGTFYSYDVSDSAVVRNCFVNAIGATVYYKTENKFGLSNLILGTRAKKVENLVVVCDGSQSDDILTKSGATATANSYTALRDSVACQGAFEEFDEEQWKLIGILPFLKSYASNLDVTEAVRFENSENLLLAGQDLEIKLNIPYYILTATLCDGVTLADGILSASSTANNGKVTITATSILNNSQATLEITIKKAELLEIPHERILLESSSTDIDLSFASEYSLNDVTLSYGNVILGKGTVTGGKLHINLSTVTDIGELTFSAYCNGDNIYKFDVNVKLVTKIIRNAEDLKSVMITQELLGKNQSIFGLYVLENDIDLAGASIGGELAYDNSMSSPCPMWREDYGFRGTFDGQGKTISNFKIVGRGFFGHLGTGSVVRNVNFTNVEMTGGYNNAIFAQGAFNSLIEKVNITITKYKTANSDKHCQGFISSRYMFNCTLKNVNIDASAFDVYSIFGYEIVKQNGTTNTCQDVVIKVKSYQMFGYSSGSPSESSKVREMSGVTF